MHALLIFITRSFRRTLCDKNYFEKLILFFFSQGSGRYAIYIANYASGDVGPHALIEMDEAASDLSQGVIALSSVAEQAGVNKFTGRFK